MRRNSGIIGPGSEVDREDAKGIHDLTDAYNYRLEDEWPYSQNYISHSLSPGTTIDEGQTITLTVNVDGFDEGEQVYYSINTVAGPTMTGADFDDGVILGGINVSNGVATLNKTLATGVDNENNQFQFMIRRGSTSGEIWDTSATITVTDVTPVVGQVNYTSYGNYTWTAPAGVTSVCVVAIGGGGGGYSYYYYYHAGGGGGGGLGWRNDIAVTPNTNYSLYVGSGGGASQSGATTWFLNSSTVRGTGGTRGYRNSDSYGGSYTGDGGGNGGYSDYTSYYGGPAGGGGAGGYSGSGGRGRQSTYGDSGSGGAAGGGGRQSTYYAHAYGGGGVGLYGQGNSGSGGNYGGYGGSGGGQGSSNIGGWYGGGGGGSTNWSGRSGDNGALRIIWGSGRAYPSTLTTDQ